MELSQTWKKCFAAWPESMPRRGILVTTFGEQVVFSGFLTGEAMLLVHRKSPDALGARQLILPYEHIAAVKITDVVKIKSVRELGFEGSLPAG